MNVMRFNDKESASVGGYSSAISNIPIDQEKKQYFEFTASGSNGYCINLMDKESGFINQNPTNYYRPVKGFIWYVNAAISGSYPRNAEVNAVYETKYNSFSNWDGAIAIDPKNKHIKLYYNGVLFHDIDILLGDYPLYISIAGCHQYGCSFSFNFGETDFKYSIPDGYISVHNAINDTRICILENDNSLYGMRGE